MNLPDYIFTWNEEDGLPEVAPTESDDRIAEFLQSDLQGDTGICDYLIGKLTSTRHFEFSGNASSLEYKDGIVTLGSLFDDKAEPCVIPADEFLALVERWKLFLLSR